MRIGDTLVAFLGAAAPLLVLTSTLPVAKAVSPSCPSAYRSLDAPPFDQSCQNACSSGASAGEIVGPAILTSGEAPQYDVAAIYYGHQNCGGCVGMVSAMTSAYSALAEEDRERVFLLAVGKAEYAGNDQNFCQGFAACADESGAPWWTALDAAQRDVVFYIKTDPNNDESWEFYCGYSMNSGRDEFDDTLREMLAITAAATATVSDESSPTGVDTFGNETRFDEPEEESFATLLGGAEEPPRKREASQATSEASLVDSSSSYVGSSYAVSLMASVSILAWSMLV